ncbi:hypothetical protein LEN26_009973 [Aphanomyces euteiches]|nr:hypothetical protein AeMF1_018255 [Aphanomyces euteiches]KAH9123345.1 hypothetical protein LEN26_009973 [Aphanomyces euteiches]KAH9193177.1 hypothetical protein AeNC1_004852 [Aphanomyces euteiches]
MMLAGSARILRRSFATNIYVEGLHRRTDDVRLRQAFDKFGNVIKVAIIPAQDNEVYLKGCVSFKKSEDALKAIMAMNGQELDGRLLKVDYYDDTF